MAQPSSATASRAHRNVQRFRGGLVFKAHRLCLRGGPRHLIWMAVLFIVSIPVADMHAVVISDERVTAEMAGHTYQATSNDVLAAIKIARTKWITHTIKVALFTAEGAGDEDEGMQRNQALVAPTPPQGVSVRGHAGPVINELSRNQMAASLTGWRR